MSAICEPWAGKNDHRTGDLPAIRVRVNGTYQVFSPRIWGPWRGGIDHCANRVVHRGLHLRLECLHSVSMPNVLIRDVPENVHARLQARADGGGQSLQQYLAGELRRLAERPSMEEVLARIAAHRGGRVGLERAVRDMAAERHRR